MLTKVFQKHLEEESGDDDMPASEVMHKFKHGMLHSGSKKGPQVKNRKQAIAIMLSEKKAAGEGKKEYQEKVKTGPSAKMKKKHGFK